MKIYPNFLFLAILVLVAGFLFQNQPAVTPVSAQTTGASDCSNGRSIQVSGTATVYVIPDRALIELGVQSNSTTPDLVHEENLRAIQRVMNAVKTLGVEPKDVATDHYIVVPIYSDYNSLVIKGYRIDNTIAITLKDVSLADEVIKTALKAGSNEVRNVQFYTSELRKFRDQARELAMKAAGEKAQALAGAAKAQTGCLLSASENISSYYYGSWHGGRNAAIWTQNVAQNSSPSQGAPDQLGNESPVSLGQIAVQAQVSASYSLK